MQAVQTSGLVRIGAHVGMFAAGDDLQGLHGHMGEIFQAQAAQGLSTESFFCRARVRRVRSSSEERAQRTQMPGKRSRTQASNWRSEPRPWGLLVP